MKKKAGLTVLFIFSLLLSLWSFPSWARDPFRPNSNHYIGEKTEQAFQELFQQGNYKQAKIMLIDTTETEELNEPLYNALRASLAYTEYDWETVHTYAQKTLNSAESLKNNDPLRANLYLAAGHVLDGAYDYEKEKDVFAALNQLPVVFAYIDEAEKIDANDPELNLIKGFLDLLLAVNLPFSSPEQAIERFQNYAAPDYLVYRGLAVAYRDLKQPDKALQFVDQALQITPENPELYYLKAQILRSSDQEEKDLSILETALGYFDQALTKADQLPEFIIKSLRRERRKTQEKIDELTVK